MIKVMLIDEEPYQDITQYCPDFESGDFVVMPENGDDIEICLPGKSPEFVVLVKTRFTKSETIFFVESK